MDPRRIHAPNSMFKNRALGPAGPRSDSVPLLPAALLPLGTWGCICHAFFLCHFYPRTHHDTLLLAPGASTQSLCSPLTWHAPAGPWVPSSCLFLLPPLCSHCPCFPSAFPCLSKSSLEQGWGKGLQGVSGEMRVELQKQRGWSSYQSSLITTLCAILFLAFIPKLEGEASGIVGPWDRRGIWWA